MRRRPVLPAALGRLALAPAASAQTVEREHLDVRVFAPVGDPGFPASSLVTAAGDVVVGTYASSMCCTGPSKVFRWDSAGTLTDTWTVQGQDPEAMNGVQVATDDRAGRLYLLDKVGGRATTLDPATGEQAEYATFPDVPSCTGAPNEGPCSQSLADNPPQPNYAAWGPDGALYVTDFLQALVWRVPPHGGEAQVWLTDARLDGLQFGPTSIVYRPESASFLLGVFAGRPGPDSAGTGALYTLPLRADGAPGELLREFESNPADGVDGFTIAESGHVYVALLGPTANAVVELDENYERVAQVPATPLDNQAQEVPFDSPSSVSFLDERLIVTNHAVLSGNTDNMVLFDVFAGETGVPRFVPASAGPVVAMPTPRPTATPAAADDGSPSGGTTTTSTASSGSTSAAATGSRGLADTGGGPPVVPAALVLLAAGLAAGTSRRALRSGRGASPQ